MASLVADIRNLEVERSRVLDQARRHNFARATADAHRAALIRSAIAVPPPAPPLQVRPYSRPLLTTPLTYDYGRFGEDQRLLEVYDLSLRQQASDALRREAETHARRREAEQRAKAQLRTDRFRALQRKHIVLANEQARTQPPLLPPAAAAHRPRTRHSVHTRLQLSPTCVPPRCWHSCDGPEAVPRPRDGHAKLTGSLLMCT